MNINEIRAMNAAIAEMQDMIEMAIANRNLEIGYGEEVAPVEEYIAGWLISNGYQK
jgi:hypothetical protein